MVRRIDVDGEFAGLEYRSHFYMGRQYHYTGESHG